jgi:hypothetical protein
MGVAYLGDFELGDAVPGESWQRPDSHAVTVLDAAHQAASVAGLLSHRSADLVQRGKRRFRARTVSLAVDRGSAPGPRPMEP